MVIKLLRNTLLDGALNYYKDNLYGEYQGFYLSISRDDLCRRFGRKSYQTTISDCASNVEIVYQDVDVVCGMFTGYGDATSVIKNCSYIQKSMNFAGDFAGISENLAVMESIEELTAATGFHFVGTTQEVQAETVAEVAEAQSNSNIPPLSDWEYEKSGSTVYLSHYKGTATKVQIPKQYANQKLYAQWERKYTITYDYNGGAKIGENDNPTSYTEKQRIVLASPGRSYFRFGGSGSMPKYDNVPYGESFKLKKNTFTRKGYEFVGWSKSADGKVEFSDGQKVSNLSKKNNGVVNLYAVWKIVNYTITYKTFPDTLKGVNYKSNPTTYTIKKKSATPQK